ncbi:WD40 repeat-like protein [Ascobolus immersus RN42]|uniref:WD40 repeat-like protein n=1 Tax=Ascobolus immersus RN42 TaxID=1160509 RepID=A0A3N4HXG8_ASCIM|nr:WD40 repeat-like protein [Ascobolus immersus RN42]
MQPDTVFRMDEGYSESPNVEEDTSFARQGSDTAFSNWLMQLPPRFREDFLFNQVKMLPYTQKASLIRKLVDSQHIDFIQHLPVEISLQILSYIDLPTLLNAAVVSKTWRRFALEPHLWRRLFIRENWVINQQEVEWFEREVLPQKAAEQEQKRLASEEYDGSRVAKKMKWTDEDLDTPMVGGESSSNHGWDKESERREESQSVTVFSEGRTATNEYAPSLITANDRRPRLNWYFLYKMRKLLEDNWKLSNYTTFMIPHPDHYKEGHSDSIYTLQFSSRYLVSGSKDRTIRIWDLRTRRLLQAPLEGHHGSVLCVQFDESEDEDVIISGSSDASVIVWRFSTGELIKRIPSAHKESVLNLKFTKEYLVTCSKDRMIKVWNRQRILPNDPNYPVDSKVLYPQKRLHIPIEERRVIEPYTCLQVLRGHVAAVNAIQIHGDEIASGSGDRILKVWNIKTGECLRSLPGHDKGIACVQYDGETIVSGSSDQTVRVFSRTNGAESAQLIGHGDLVRTVQASTQGNQDGPSKIVSGSYDETIRIWRKVGKDWAPGATLIFGRALAQARERALLAPTRQPPLPSVEQQNEILAALSRRAMNTTNSQSNGSRSASNPLSPSPIPDVLPSTSTVIPAPVQATLEQEAAAIATQQTNSVAAAPAPIGGGRACRVFKLQFDPRMIVCCSQDTKMVGWDFANDEPDLLEASRFFK